MVNEFDKCLAHDVIVHLTQVMMEDPTADVAKASKRAAAQNYSRHCITHDTMAKAAESVDALVTRVITAVNATRWYTKHTGVANLVASQPWNAAVKWTEQPDGMWILTIDGKPQKKSTAINVKLYQAYRVVHHRAAELYNLAPVATSSSASPAVITTKLQMHWEEVYTPKAFKEHGETLYKALHSLIRILK